jgi:predicted ArsR family transcriptional regulator
MGEGDPMTTTRQEILSLIKHKGPMTVHELSLNLRITPMGVRQHLAILERDGFVRSNGIRRGQGRPSRLYAISPQGDNLFPRTYEQLAQMLLDDLRTVKGETTIDEVFEHRRKRLVEQYRARMAGREFRDKIALLAKARDEDGYLAEHAQLDRDRFILIEHNCPIRAVAEVHQQTCRCEMALFQEVLGADVVRTHHILGGAPHCRYVITRPPDADSKP